jgi:hypothetical protein
VRDGGLAAEHTREPGSIRELFRKERWRGIASLEGARRHGLTWGELPSLALPLAHGALGVGLAGAAIAGETAFAGLLAGLLALPSLALALRTARRANAPGELPALAGFWLVYNAARTAALVPSPRSSS